MKAAHLPSKLPLYDKLTSDAGIIWGNDLSQMKLQSPVSLRNSTPSRASKTQ